MSGLLRRAIGVVVLAVGTTLVSPLGAQTGAGQATVALLSPPGLPAAARSTLGDLHGVTRDPSGQAVPQAKVTIHSAEESIDRAVVSDADGRFVAEHLKPGRYRLTARKEGFAGSSETTIEVAAGESLHNDITLGASGGFGGGNASAPATSAAANGSVVNASELQPLLHEVEALRAEVAQLKAQVEHADGKTPAAPAAIAEGQPAGHEQSAKPTAQQLSSGGAASVQPTPAAASSTLLASAGSTPPLPAAAGPVLAGATAPSETPAPLTQAAAPQSTAKATPFSDADWTWLNGNPRTKDIFWDSKFFTPEIRADTSYVYDFNHPTDHSIGGSSELFRSQEVQLEQLGVGGDFHFDNVRARLMTQFGLYSETTPRNDASPGNGQWDLDTAYRYLSEAYGGYHFDVLHGINVDAGIFMSYIGLFSYYNFDNWAYQPSYVSSNTPWFFNGVRVQIFPTEHLKIEPWFINGWQSYASANHRPGLGGQIKWTPFPWMNIISNNYGLGHDDLFIPNRGRIHTDNSIEIKYYDQPLKSLDKMAFSFTGDMGCEFGGGVSCDTDTKNGPKQSFLGFMLYNRFWFYKDLFGLTLGGGEINNPGRYLVLLPPINGETAISAATNSPYFTENPGDPFKAWDSSITFDYMPKQYITFRIEGDYRHANVPYWSGAGGITPPGGNDGYPSEYACLNGSPSLTVGGCATNGGLWTPDLRKDETFIDMDILVKF